MKEELARDNARDLGGARLSFFFPPLFQCGVILRRFQIVETACFVCIVSKRSGVAWGQVRFGIGNGTRLVFNKCSFHVIEGSSVDGPLTPFREFYNSIC